MMANARNAFEGKSVMAHGGVTKIPINSTTVFQQALIKGYIEICNPPPDNPAYIEDAIKSLGLNEDETRKFIIFLVRNTLEEKPNLTPPTYPARLVSAVNAIKRYFPRTLHHLKIDASEKSLYAWLEAESLVVDVC